MFVTSNAIDDLKYYLLPDFSKFNFTVFSQAATQVLFSVGIGNIIISLRFVILNFHGWMLPEYHTWGFKEYEKELTNDGKFGRVTLYDKILTCIVVPIFMIIIILNVFGFIR